MTQNGSETEAAPPHCCQTLKRTLEPLPTTSGTGVRLLLAGLLGTPSGGSDRGWFTYGRPVELGTFAGFGLALCAGFACLFVIAVVGLVAACWKAEG